VEHLGATDILWRTCYQIGRRLILEKKYPEAREYLARAIDCLELTRSRLREDTVKKMFAASIQDVYAEMINLLFEMNATDEGFNYLERSKGRAFLDILAGRSLSAQKTIDRELAMKENEASRKIERLRRSFETTVGPKQNAIYDEYKRAIAEHRAILDSIKDKSLEFAATTSVATIPVQQLSARLEVGDILLSYFIRADKIIIWTVKRGGLKAVSAAVRPDVLAGLVRDYREAIARRQTGRILNLGKQLYEIVIAPVKNELSGTRKLYIVPTGNLHYLPFAGLNDPAGRFLIQDFTVSVLPNATSLYYLDKDVTADRDHILALGDPLFKNPRLSLQFADNEIRAVCRYFPKSLIFTKTDARESVLRDREIRDTGVVHIAAHGVYNVQDPLASALLLAGDDTYDGNLETVEIYSLTMNPRLVVLSACQSGVGEVENGDEVQSLNRAFLYAGAGSVISSLWNVNDKATAVFMDEFYRNMKSMNTADALREAQLALQKTAEYNSPYYWAAFYLIGGRQ
jgi:CHAT domain-containing protein